MKGSFSYVTSFFVSVLLVFSLAATVLCLTAKRTATESCLIRLTNDKNVSGLVYDELERYFLDKSHTTDIPADVYMNAIDDDYITSIINSKISGGFATLNGDDYTVPDFTNGKMENKLNKYFSEYAQNIGYEKDEKYEKKLNKAISDAYSIIGEYCDVFKFGAMGKHGVLNKVSPIYTRLELFLAFSAAAAVIFAALLMLINVKSISASLYWIGTSALVSGILGAVPCGYLLASDYFSSFTIKQAQIYTAYTGMMNLVTQDLLTAFIITAVSGAVCLTVYAVICHIKNNSILTESTAE